MRKLLCSFLLFGCGLLTGCDTGLDRDALLEIFSSRRNRADLGMVSRKVFTAPPDVSSPAQKADFTSVQKPRRKVDWDEDQAIRDAMWPDVGSSPMGQNVGGRCAGSSRGKLCLALRYVVYRDSQGLPVESEEEASKKLERVNQIWQSCEIGFQMDHYFAVRPSELNLRFRTAEYSELEEIRRRLTTSKELLVVVTGAWDRQGSIGNTWANAWTTLPGESYSGAILEGAVSGSENVLAHELGHYLSLGHSEERASLMHPVIYLDSTQLRAEDCVAARWAISQYWEQMLR